MHWMKLYNQAIGQAERLQGLGINVKVSRRYNGFAIDHCSTETTSERHLFSGTAREVSTYLNAMINAVLILRD